MKSTLFIIIVLLSTLFISTLKIDFDSFVELSDLKGDSYAESLIQTIEATVNTKGGSIENIQTLLTDLYNKLVESQKTADKLWATREGSLNKTISDTQKVIDDLNAEIKALEAKIAKYNAMILQAGNNLKQYNVQLTADTNMQVSLGQKRNKDSVAAKLSSEQHSSLILAVGEVIKVLRGLVGSISGLRPTHVNSTDFEKRDEAWKKAHPALLEIFTEKDVNSFLQVATEADQEGLNKLIALLLGLENSAKKSLADDAAAEAESLSYFNKLNTRLSTDIGLLRDAIKKQTDNLNSYSKIVADSKVTLNTKNALLTKNIAFRDENIKIRATEKAKWIADTNQRNYERKVIQRLMKIVEEKLSKMSALLRGKVN